MCWDTSAMHDTGRTRSAIKVQGNGNRNGDERNMKSGKFVEKKRGLVGRYREDIEYTSSPKCIFQ